MNATETPQRGRICSLKDAARLNSEKILNKEKLNFQYGISENTPVLVILVAGKGTRFGKDPKCIQPVHNTPLARHSIDAFHRVSFTSCICIVGYRYEEVSESLGKDNTYVLSDNPAGGTAFAAFEAFCVPGLLEKNPLLIVTMGDRIVPSSIFRAISKVHCDGPREADLTFLTAVYEPPKNTGKGRVVRDDNDKVIRIIEERDILADLDEVKRQRLLGLTEGNCPLYAVRAATLYKHLLSITNSNAQEQYYLTDIIHSIVMEGGDIRTITTTVNDPEYDLLCSDVTQPIDLALLEGILSSNIGLLVPEEVEVEETVRIIIDGRPTGQVASIARQFEELYVMIRQEKLNFEPDKPVGIGISGGRLRIAFMHPDMVRFYGPAWQMPIGAIDEEGEEQIVILLQNAEDGRIHLTPMNQRYRESINSISADYNEMYPGEEVCDINAYEKFGTRMSKGLLLSLGYFSDEELEERRRKNQPLPPSSLWISSNMRRPFALVGNAIASLRTLRTGNLGLKVRENLGSDNFRGLRIVSDGNIPQGGFSSSSAVTVATKNAINSLFDIGISSDLLVHLACQAEYGTGVRAGSLDQATEQKGRTGEGTLISSNPKDNYRIISTYSIPNDRFKIIFPYSVDRDRVSWKWSWGCYSDTVDSGRLTTTEIRKMTGKAAEIAAILVHLPLETDFFKHIEDDIVADGLLNPDNRKWISSILTQLPVLISQTDLQEKVFSNLDWYAGQLMAVNRLDELTSKQKAYSIIKSLFEGWRNPIFKRTEPSGKVVEEQGVPLRAMVAYLFGEVAKNFYLIHHNDKWIEYISRSQRGDCSFDIDPECLPSRAEMETGFNWEKGFSGPQLLDLWLEKFKAKPFDFNRGLDDQSLSKNPTPEFHKMEGSGFFRGLALIDLAEAMLKKAFGTESVAIRVNAAGQGDYFQVHIDTQKADPENIKRFIRLAFYRRFGITPDQEFVEVHSGGGAVGVRISRFDILPQLIQRLRSFSFSTP